MFRFGSYGNNMSGQRIIGIKRPEYGTAELSARILTPLVKARQNDPVEFAHD